MATSSKYRSKKSACGLCKPHKQGWAKKHKPQHRLDKPRLWDLVWECEDWFYAEEMAAYDWWVYLNEGES